MATTSSGERLKKLYQRVGITVFLLFGEIACNPPQSPQSFEVLPPQATILVNPTTTYTPHPTSTLTPVATSTPEPTRKPQVDLHFPTPTALPSITGVLTISPATDLQSTNLFHRSTRNLGAYCQNVGERVTAHPGESFPLEDDGASFYESLGMMISGDDKPEKFVIKTLSFRGLEDYFTYNYDLYGSKKFLPLIEEDPKILLEALQFVISIHETLHACGMESTDFPLDQLDKLYSETGINVPSRSYFTKETATLSGFEVVIQGKIKDPSYDVEVQGWVVYNRIEESVVEWLTFYDSLNDKSASHLHKMIRRLPRFYDEKFENFLTAIDDGKLAQQLKDLKQQKDSRKLVKLYDLLVSKASPMAKIKLQESGIRNPTKNLIAQEAVKMVRASWRGW